MILTVTLNPTIDRVVEIPNFQINKVSRIEKERVRLDGGKGINVSQIVRVLGEETLVIGWIGGSNSKI